MSAFPKFCLNCFLLIILFQRNVNNLEDREDHAPEILVPKKKGKIDADELRNEHNILTDGFDVTFPIVSFEHLKIESYLKQNLRKSKYTKPTPIQMQGN